MSSSALPQERRTITRGIASAKRLKEVLSSRPVIRDGDREDVPLKGGSIELRNVSFTYPGHHHEVHILFEAREQRGKDRDGEDRIKDDEGRSGNDERRQ